MSMTATSAPASDMSAAVASPIPDEAPVINVRNPINSFIAATPERESRRSYIIPMV